MTSRSLPVRHIILVAQLAVLASVSYQAQPVAGDSLSPEGWSLRYDDTQPRSALPAVVGGVLGGGLGFVGGAIIGARVCLPDCREFDALVGAVWGAFLGEALLLPLGVHIGNGTHGNLRADYGASSGMALVALGTGLAVSSLEILVLGIAGQIAATVWAERNTGAQSRLSVNVTANGRLAVGLRAPLPWQ